jgi:3-hydroxyisobutyrate dehydrogenase-like beta-hydroxyacid dehydrogenase
MSTIGFLGLGSMGSIIASRFVEAGFDVIAWNRSLEALESLVDAGSRAASSPIEALAAPVSFSMLANDDAVDAVLTAENFNGPVGRIHVCLSSISPAAADRVEAACRSNEVGYLSAPVLGRPEAAAAGQLNVLVAGPPEAVANVEKLLAVFGVRIWRMGQSPRIANVVKIAVNYNIIHALQAIGESVALTEQHGIDAAEFVELLHSTLFGGVVYGVYGRLIAERKYLPAGFTLELGLKDLLLADEVAGEAQVVLATMPALIETFRQALGDPGLTDSDWSAIAEVSRKTKSS